MHFKCGLESVGVYRTFRLAEAVQGFCLGLEVPAHKARSDGKSAASAKRARNDGTYLKRPRY